MKLQHKAWALILIVVAIGAGGAMLGTRYLVGQSFDRLESERAVREGERARRVLQQQHQALVASARDYAYWLDSVQFLAGTRPSFIADNFDAENLGYLRISEVLVFDPEGQVHATVAREGEDALGEGSRERLADLRELAKPLLASGDAKQVLKTFRVKDGQLELVVAAAVHDPDDGSGRVHGAIMMVRFFDAQELTGLADVLMTPTRLSFEVAAPAGEDTYVLPVDEGNDELYAVLKDHRDLPVAALVLTLDRQLQQKAQELTWQGMGLAGLAGLLGSALLVWLLDRLILQRLQRLHSDVQRITAQGPMLAAAASSGGNDELSHLGDGINRLLTRVRDDAAVQQAASERQEALQLQLLQSQKTEALGRFTSGIAHDFNNSLAAIGGWMRLADEDLDKDHPSHDALQQALKATRYANGLMRQLLAFSRQSAPRLEGLRVCHLIEESRMLVASGLLQTCELVVSCPEKTIWVRADLTQMQQVLVNLMMNASDAMGGSGKIWLSVESRAFPLGADEVVPEGAAGLAPGRYVCLTVRDEGPGISPEHINRVFDPFFTTKTVGKGTGLGLSVAHGIMARHGGAIGVSSEQGVGTSMHLYLPESPAPADAVDSGMPGLAKTDSDRRLLFVDDDQLVRHAWGTLLERQGWLVTRARDGEEGWHLFQQSHHGWAVVLTDLSMPKLDGIGLAQRIRATDSPPPIVLMSGNVSVEDAAHLTQTDFAAVLHKPVDAEQLQAALKDAMAFSG